MFNDIEAYREAGFKAGRAVTQNDQARANFHRDWLNRALVYEQGEDKARARLAYDAAYAKGRGLNNRPQYFR